MPENKTPSKKATKTTKKAKPKAKPAKKVSGRPSAFKPEYLEQARKLALLGLTDVEMANIFGVSKVTFNSWKQKKVGFLNSLKKGKEIADADVAASLYQRACGYEHKAVKMFQYEGVIISEEYTERYAPDTAAAFIWLKNRQPKLWRDKTSPEDDAGLPPESVSFTFNVVDGRKVDNADTNKAAS